MKQASRSRNASCTLRAKSFILSASLSEAIFPPSQVLPESILGMGGSYFVFDEEGFLDEATLSEAIEFTIRSVAPSLSSHGHPVIDLQSRAKKRELEEKHRWEPTPPERQKIAAAALGHPKRIVNVKSVKHPPPREPTISFESRQAFNKLCELDWRAGLEMMNLSEQDLCGLKRLLEEKLDKKDGSGAIMRGIVQRVDEKLRIRHLRRTGEGEWYAVVQLFKWAENYSGEVVRDWSQRCPTHQEALQLVRQLTAENAHHIGEHMSLESRLVSALEWDTDED